MQYKVKFKDGFEKCVYADYFKIENGVLLFRCQRKGPGLYPETVCVIAPGWLSMDVHPDAV